MKKRDFVKLTTGSALALGILPSTFMQGFSKSSNSHSSNFDEFTLPNLPYRYDALEPYFDKATMEVHHDKHHAAYVANLNKAITNTAYENVSLDLICNRVTEKDVAVRNNAGGHYNHSLFWSILISHEFAFEKPDEDLMLVIQKSFGSWEAFKEAFNTAAKNRFGSGWAWLSVNGQKDLFVSSTPNQDNPMMSQIIKYEEHGVPILALDVWEHAYYLKYQNRRVDYIESFWNIINWAEVSKRYKACL